MLIENPAFIGNYTGFKNLKVLASIQNRVDDEHIREVIHQVGLDPDDKRTYSIPLYLRDDTLLDLVRNEAVDFSEEQAIDYQRFLSLDGLGADSLLADIESELDILHEIGLINLSEDGDEGDIYSAINSIFSFRIGAKKVGRLSLYDKELMISYICTGNLTYTKMGLDLYNSLKDVYPPYSELYSLLKAYIQLQKNR